MEETVDAYGLCLKNKLLRSPVGPNFLHFLPYFSDISSRHENTGLYSPEEKKNSVFGGLPHLSVRPEQTPQQLS